MKSRNSTISWAVILMAACSLFSMLGTFQVDQIVHGDLYKYGLQFSYAWATPYWNTTGFVFAMGWFNIVVALIVEVRLLAVKRKSLKRTKSQAKKKRYRLKQLKNKKRKNQNLLKLKCKQKSRKRWLLVLTYRRKKRNQLR